MYFMYTVSHFRSFFICKMVGKETLRFLPFEGTTGDEVCHSPPVLLYPRDPGSLVSHPPSHLQSNYQICQLKGKRLFQLHENHSPAEVSNPVIRLNVHTEYFIAHLSGKHDYEWPNHNFLC